MEQLLTIDELAEKLKVNKAFIKNLIFKKQIPYIKISYKTIRFDPVEIEIWLKKRTVSKENSETSVLNFPTKKRKTSLNTSHDRIKNQIDRIIKEAKADFLNKANIYTLAKLLYMSVYLSYALLGGLISL